MTSPLDVPAPLPAAARAGASGTNTARAGAPASIAPGGSGDAADERAREIDGAARAFEKLLVQRMLGDMRRASRGGESPDNAMANWESMFDEEIADVVTRRGGLGFGDALSRDLGGSGSVALVREGARTGAPAGLPAADAAALRRFARGADAPGDDDPAPVPMPVRRPNGGLPLAALAATAAAPVTSSPAVTGDLETDFLAPLHDHARRAARRLGTAPEAILAVAALETGWGRHRIVDRDGADSHNLFGIKATGAARGDAVEHRTTEFIGGAPRRVQAEFRRFEDVGDAVDGFADFVLGNPRYAPALAAGDDPETFVRELARAGYATDPDYADKVVDVMRRVRARLDAGVGPDVVPGTRPGLKESIAPPPTGGASPTPSEIPS